jgi:serine O-acetyltransferase
MNGLPSRMRPHYRMTHPVLHFVRLLRVAEYWSYSPAGASRIGRIVSALARYRARRAGLRLGLDVPCGVFGPGLSIAHPGLLVVNGDARVGARCRVSQGVTIGATDSGAPSVGDDVFVGPNALILGPVTIGDGAFIYPGAVVTKDVPARHAAKGVPATIYPHEGSPWRPGTGFSRITDRSQRG